MKLGIIGRGYWGDVYAETLRNMGIPFWQAGRNWKFMGHADGIIIASEPKSHHALARRFIFRYTPVLIEKPICMNMREAKDLLRLAQQGGRGSIVFAGHTRLYSTAWRDFKATAIAAGVKTVSAVAGSTDCKLHPLWDWGPHLIAMCLDLGFDPMDASIVTSESDVPLKIVVNGTLTYMDAPETPRPLECLMTEFMGAIDRGEADIRGLLMGCKVIEVLQSLERKKRAA